eukprot:CAMPEP_0171561624 /NCGR_PEP_ID=MMETSP0960-20121227/14463_1 /TAXON_ID=87120 /ORGANISM="Aurantiochytrium limacinum, Strain ATCCMYA-1381" /LENGTH=63 /DNA_ID=CAMNT_0012114171 /DNA_START=211 /DNA_END=402 /DNA_ORIENTATION=+
MTPAGAPRRGASSLDDPPNMKMREGDEDDSGGIVVKEAFQRGLGASWPGLESKCHGFFGFLPT